MKVYNAFSRLDMNKEQRQIEVLASFLLEEYRIEQVIESLPRGYISVKQIAGHTYYYRQWREGDKIISNYVPEAFLKGVKQKIVIRKENEQLLKIVKKDISKSTKAVLKAGLLSEEQVVALKEGVKNDDVKPEERQAFIEKAFPEANNQTKKAMGYYVEGVASYNDVLLASWGL